MVSDRGQIVQSFSSLSDALGSLEHIETILVTRKTGLAALKNETLTESLRIVIAPEGEPKLSDILDFEVKSLKGVTRIVSLGGGSVIDFSKGLAVLAEFPELRSKMLESSRSSYSVGSAASTIEHVVIPTRAGSGSEASSSAIFRDGSRKIPIYGPSLIPSRIFWVPSLLSPDFKSNLSGMLDMVGHAFESLLSTKADSILDVTALDTMQLAIEFGKKTELGSWDNLRLLRASAQAGLCQDVRLVSLPHALAHSFSNDLAHGLMVGNFLKQFIKGLRAADKNLFSYLEELFERQGISIPSLLEVLEEWVREANAISGVDTFEKVTLEEAQTAIEDPAARLTKTSVNEHSFGLYDFQRPVRQGRNG
jgi:alcohol dehydrogenase class IV